VYPGSRLATKLKVMGVDLTSMGDVHGRDADCEVVSHSDPAQGVYKKLVLRDGRLAGAILLGTGDPGGKLLRLFKEATPLDQPPLELLAGESARDALLEAGSSAELQNLPDDTQICNCNMVSKGRIVADIRAGQCTIPALGACNKAGTGCGTCQPLLGQLINLYGKAGGARSEEVNKIEVVKKDKDGLDCLPDIYRLADGNHWEDMTEEDKHRFKWHGLFFRKPTPGNFMLRLR